MRELQDVLGNECVKCIHSDQEPEVNRDIIDMAVSGRINILFISPERINNKYWMDAFPKINISLVVIDEAHCISMWGHDFRPDYQKIGNFIAQIPHSNFSVLAMTATAPELVEKDIKKQMLLTHDQFTSIRGDLCRPNLHLDVVKVCNEEEKLVWLALG